MDDREWKRIVVSTREDLMTIEYSVSAGVAEIVPNRPDKLNAVNSEICTCTFQ